MGDRWQGRKYRSGDDSRRGTTVVGLLLVLLGVYFLASEQLKIDEGPNAWPLFVIAPGVVLLAIGMAVPHEGGLGAAIPGGILTAVGLVLVSQAATDTYASWAYAWALVAPGSVGVTLALYGLLHRRWDLLDSGLKTAAVGLGLFVGFGLFFEDLIGLGESQNGVLRNSLPWLAVGLGVVIVIMNLVPWRPGAHRVGPDDWTSPEPPPTPPPTPPAG